MLVDVPIDLGKGSKRACDVDAKKFLGGAHQSSVFYTPIRDAVESGTPTPGHAQGLRRIVGISARR